MQNKRLLTNSHAFFVLKKEKSGHRENHRPPAASKKLVKTKLVENMGLEPTTF